MITNDDKLFIKYQKFIEIIISKYKEYIKDDLRQDLLIFLLELLESINIDNIKNLDGYIFISLKNKAFEEYNTKYKFYESNISLDNLHFEKTSYLDRMSYDNNIVDIDDTVCPINLNEILVKTLSIKERKVINSYYFENKNESEIAKEMGISQQYISKVLIRSIRKLRNYFNKNSI